MKKYKNKKAFNLITMRKLMSGERIYIFFIYIYKNVNCRFGIFLNLLLIFM